MATGDLTQIEASIRARGYELDTATEQLDIINQVYRRIAGGHQWQWLDKKDSTKSTAIGVETVDISALTDIQTVTSVYLPISGVNDCLAYRSPEEFDDLRTVFPFQAYPEYWTIEDENQTIRLWPTPNAVQVVTIRYQKNITPLSGSTDVPLFDVGYTDVLVVGACQILASRERDWNAYDQWGAEYTNRLAEMQGKLGIRQRQTSTQVRKSGFFYT